MARQGLGSEENQPVGPVQLVDAADNARFHAPAVEFSYAELLQKRLEREES
jgi:hypothetical protein